MKFRVAQEYLVDAYGKKDDELSFKVKMVVGGKIFEPLVTIYRCDNLDTARFGKDFDNLVIHLDKYYNDIIRMCNEWCKAFVAEHGGPGKSTLDNDSKIDATIDFDIKQIFIDQKESTYSTYPENKQYKYDSVVWFVNWNDRGRGFDAHFYKGKLVNVEMAP